MSQQPERQQPQPLPQQQQQQQHQSEQPSATPIVAADDASTSAAKAHKAALIAQEAKPKHLSPAAAKRAATPTKIPFRPTGPVLEPTPYATSMVATEEHATNNARLLARSLNRDTAPLNFEILSQRHQPSFQYEEGSNSVGRRDHERQQQQQREQHVPSSPQQDAEEMEQQLLRIQRMQQLVESMADTNSIERQRAKALRSVKLGDAIDRAHEIQGEAGSAAFAAGDTSQPRDRLGNMMRRLVATSSPAPAGPTGATMRGAEDDPGNSADPSLSSPSSSQRRLNRPRVIMSPPAADEESNATTISNSATNPQQQQQPQSHETPTRSLLASGSTASSIPRQQQQQQQQLYSDPHQQQQTPTISASKQQQHQQPTATFDGYIGIGDDPLDPLHASPARGAVELLRKDAMSDGGIMLPYNKMRLRSLARRSSPVLSRIPPFRQQEAAAAAENVRLAAKAQKEALERIKQSAIIDVASAALKRKEGQFVEAVKEKKQELQAKKHKSATEELAERAFRRKFGIPFEEAVVPRTVREQQLLTAQHQQQQLSGEEGRGDSCSSSNVGSSSNNSGVRASTPRAGGIVSKKSPMSGGVKTAAGGGSSTPRRATTAGTAHLSSTSKPQTAHATAMPTTMMMMPATGSVRSVPSPYPLGSSPVAVSGFVGTGSGEGGQGGLMLPAEQLPEAAIFANATLRISHAASLVHLCAQVIRGFVAPSLAAAADAVAHGAALPTMDQQRLAEHSVLQSVEAAAVAVDALLRDQNFSLEQIVATVAGLEKALRDHNAMSSRETSVTTVKSADATQQLH